MKKQTKKQKIKTGIKELALVFALRVYQYLSLLPRDLTKEEAKLMELSLQIRDEAELEAYAENNVK